MAQPGVFSPQIRRWEHLGKASPAVSVVMSSWQDKRFLRAAMESVLAQTFTDFELIVIDDGSPDPAAVTALAGLDPRIRAHCFADNLGAAGAGNRGVALARAPLIARLDSDDLAEPEWLERTVAALSGDPELGLVGASASIINERGDLLDRHAMPASDFAVRFTLLSHSPFYHSGTVYRRALFDLAGGYPADQKVSHDHYLWRAMLPHCRARNLPDYLVRYRYNGLGLTTEASAGSPRERTASIRTGLWRELGLAFPLGDPALADAAEALLRDWPCADRSAWKELAGSVRAALDAAQRALGKTQESVEFAGEILSRLERGPRLLPGYWSRWRRAVRLRGLHAAVRGALRRATNRG